MNKMKLAGLFLGALIATTSAFAAEITHKCGAEMKKDTKGSCGAGKCGSESSNEMKPKTNNKFYKEESLISLLINFYLRAFLTTH